MNDRARQRLAGAIAALLLGAVSMAANLQTQVAPNPLLAGETGQFQIISDGAVPQISALPNVPNLEWLGGPQTSTSVQIVNFQKTVSATVTYLFRVTQAGNCLIPAFAVTVNRVQQMTPATLVRVEAVQPGQAAGKGLSMEQAVLGTVRIGSADQPPPRLFVGQEIPVDVTIWVWEPMFSNRMNYPELQLENAAFVERAVPGRENPRFGRPDIGRQIRTGAPFQVVTFRCRITPLGPGIARVKGRVMLQVLLPEQRNRRRPANDPFGVFDDRLMNDLGMRQTVTREVPVELPPLTVASLPQPPSEAGYYLGLIGKATLSGQVTPATVPVGEPVSIALSVSGQGNPDSLNPPKLNIPGFRTYDPEIKKNVGDNALQATITWVLVPLSTEARLPPLTFSTFNPESGEYERYNLTTQVQITPAHQPDAGGLVADSGAPRPPPDLQASARADNVNDILYVKTRGGAGIRLPLWRNTVVPSVSLLLFGLTAYAGLSFAARRRDLLSADPVFRRRQDARRRERTLQRDLRNCPPENRAALVRERVTPFLSALLDLPPGSTPATVAGQIAAEHPELAKLLREVEAGAFRPGGPRPIDADVVLKALKRLHAILILPLFLVAALPGSARADQPVAAALQKAVAAYDQGQIEQAKVLFHQAQTSDPDPHLLYNEGNCAYRTGHLGQALAFYEKARRLKPRDSDILENLNFVRAKLGQPPVGRADTPRQLLVRLRDLLRPDEWCLAGAIAACAGLILAGVRRWRRASPLPGLAVAAVSVLASVLLQWSQAHATYEHGTHGVVTAESPGTYRLPDPESEKAQGTLHTGEPVRIVETRTGWYRVRASDAEVWVQQTDVTCAW